MRQHFPNLPIVARAVDRRHVYDLYAAGCEHIIRETFDTSVRAGRTALEVMGMHPYQADRMAKEFWRDDRYILQQMAELYDPDIPFHENKAYVERSKTLIAEREAQIFGKGNGYTNIVDNAWSPPTLKDVEAIKVEEPE